MKLARWLLIAIATAAAGAFVAELLRPRGPVRAKVGDASGYVPPPPAADRFVVLPTDG